MVRNGQSLSRRKVSMKPSGFVDTETAWILTAKTGAKWGESVHEKENTLLRTNDTTRRERKRLARRTAAKRIPHGRSSYPAKPRELPTTRKVEKNDLRIREMLDQ